MVLRSKLMILATMILLPWPAFAADDPPKKVAEPGKVDFDPYDQSKVALEVEPPADFTGKKIVIIAGRASHGPGDHEFFAGCAILVNLLKQTPNVWPVMVRDGWPKNEKVFDNAASVIFYMDGRNGHPVVQNNRLEFMQKLMDKGVGWVNLHYAVDYLPEHGQKVLSWMGGYYDFRISTNPHWDAAIRSLPNHPITKGVKPFTIRDEWYFNMQWIEGMKNVTPILQAVPPDQVRGTPDAKKYPGRLETMAWAYDRADGGRGFGFTGGHSHRNWGSESFRRIVVNAILWTAKIEIPEIGAKVDFDAIDLNRNLDRKGKNEFKMILPPEVK
jgi:type 1 glutamine amidotransferase